MEEAQRNQKSKPDVLIARYPLRQNTGDAHDATETATRVQRPVSPSTTQESLDSAHKSSETVFPAYEEVANGEDNVRAVREKERKEKESEGAR